MSMIFQETHDRKNHPLSASVLEQKDCIANIIVFDFGPSIATHCKMEANV